MRILLDNRTPEPLPRLSLSRLGAVAGRALRLPRRAAVSVSIVTGPAMRALNRRTRTRDQAADVLSFPLHARRPFPRDPDGVVRLGDVVIAFPLARRRARADGTSLAHTLQFLLVHGILHLVGYDHKRPRDTRVMEARERGILRQVS